MFPKIEIKIKAAVYRNARKLETTTYTNLSANKSSCASPNNFSHSISHRKSAVNFATAQAGEIFRWLRLMVWCVWGAHGIGLIRFEATYNPKIIYYILANYFFNNKFINFSIRKNKKKINNK